MNECLLTPQQENYIGYWASDKGRKEGNVYITTHSTHFTYSYMASDIW